MSGGIMGVARHILTNIDTETRAAGCFQCGYVTVEQRKTGVWRCIRGKHENRVKNVGANRYRRHKKSYCERCGFIAEHSCQLDVDHIDNNHASNDEGNLMTLCASCHRLKTKDGEAGKNVFRQRLAKIGIKIKDVSR